MRRQKRISCHLPSVCRSCDRVNPLGEHPLRGSRIATIIASSFDGKDSRLGFLGACREISDGLTLLPLRDSLLVDPVALSEGSQALSSAHWRLSHRLRARRQITSDFPKSCQAPFAKIFCFASDP